MSQQKHRWVTKLLIATSASVVLLAILFGVIFQRRARQYESDVFVLMQPFTNSVLESKFETHMRKAFPGISGLYYQQTSRIVFAPKGKMTTNAEVVIQLVATGKNADDTIRNANEIAPLFCKEAERLFPNAKIRILNAAVGASDNRSRDWGSAFRLGARRPFEPTKISGTVNFIEANVLLSPDPEWEQHYIAGSPYPPTLIGRGNQGEHFLSIGLFPTNQTDIVAAADDRFELVTTIALRIDSLQKDSFTADSGLFLARVSYCQNDISQGKLLRSKHSEYFTTNATGQIVQVLHVAIPADRTNGVHQMILRTLRLK
jgi:hypothetical protein